MPPTYERVPLQARLDKTVNRSFTEEARRRGMTRAGLARWLVEVYLSDTPTGRKLRAASTTHATAAKAAEVAAAPVKKKPAPKEPAPKRRPPQKRTRAPKKVSVTQGRCIHGNLGLCMECAREKAAAEV